MGKTIVFPIQLPYLRCLYPFDGGPTYELDERQKRNHRIYQLPWIPFQRVAGGLGLGRAANAFWFTEPT